MDHEYSVRLIEKSCFLRRDTALAVDHDFVICGKSSTVEGKLHFPTLVRISVEFYKHASFESATIFGKSFARHPVCFSKSAVYY